MPPIHERADKPGPFGQLLDFVEEDGMAAGKFLDHVDQSGKVRRLHSE
jgi:hypothetical protein